MLEIHKSHQNGNNILYFGGKIGKFIVSLKSQFSLSGIPVISLSTYWKRYFISNALLYIVAVCAMWRPQPWYSHLFSFPSLGRPWQGETRAAWTCRTRGGPCTTWRCRGCGCPGSSCTPGLHCPRPGHTAGSGGLSCSSWTALKQWGMFSLTVWLFWQGKLGITGKRESPWFGLREISHSNLRALRQILASCFSLLSD